MRIDNAGARTWLLAAVAAWALCAWLLALFGMGGGIERLDEDDALLRPLPGAFKPAPQRLGPLPQYAEAGSRPLFTEDRRPQPFFIDPMAESGEAANDFDFVLTSVLRTPTLEMVILQPTGGGRSLGVKVGESPEGVGGWSLVSVGARSAVFNGPQGERTLELRQFDGVGGEAPTAMAAPVVPPEGSSAPAGRAAPDEARPGAAPAMPAPQANAPAPRAPVDGGPAPGQGPAAGPARTSQEQVEAIRKRIEERRARLRRDAAQNPPAKPTP